MSTASAGRARGMWTWIGALVLGALILGGLPSVASAEPGDEVAPNPVQVAPLQIAPVQIAEPVPVAQPAACGSCAVPDCEQYPCCAPKDRPEAKCPPKYDNLRFRENWRPCLCTACCDKQDLYDRLKAVRLSNNPSIWVNVGGQVRFRFENFQNIGFGAPATNDDGWLLARIRAHADLHLGDNLRIFVEGIHADQWERELGPRPIDENHTDILNLFAEAHVPFGAGGDVGAWVGRRELQFGKQRLISPLDWANTRRTFQGAGGYAQMGAHRVDGFFTRPVTIDRSDFDEWNEDVDFFGLYYTNTCQNCVTWDVYALGLNRDAATYLGVTAEETRYTVGARADGKIPNTRFDWDAEAAYQFGDFGAGSIGALFVTGELGWKPCIPCWDPRLAIGFDYSSGDDDPTDGDIGTFNQLFPLAHAYHGYADLLGRQNLIAARAHLSVKPSEKLTVKADYHVFWRAQESDNVYNAGGGVLRAAGGSDETSLGSEFDLTFVYKVDRNWKFFGGWGHFFTGDFFTATGADEDIDFWFGGLQWTF